MKQYSIEVCHVEAAMNLVEKLGLHLTAWQINYVRGKEDYRLTFRTEMMFPEVAELLIDYDRLGTLSQDF